MPMLAAFLVTHLGRVHLGCRVWRVFLFVSPNCSPGHQGTHTGVTHQASVIVVRPEGSLSRENTKGQGGLSRARSERSPRLPSCSAHLPPGSRPIDKRPRSWGPWNVRGSPHAQDTARGVERREGDVPPLHNGHPSVWRRPRDGV